MGTASDKTVNKMLGDLPDVAEIRQRIAENIKERQLLRQLLKLAEQRRDLAAGGKKEAGK
jgi:hypothetical protein